MDAKLVCGGQSTIFVAFEGVQDHLGFCRFDSLTHGAMRARPGSLNPQVFRQTMDFDLSFMAKNKGMLDDVFKFPDISRIVVKHEKRECLLAYSRD